MSDSFLSLCEVHERTRPSRLCCTFCNRPERKVARRYTRRTGKHPFSVGTCRVCLDHLEEPKVAVLRGRDREVGK